MKITSKTTRAELVKIAQDLRDEATGWHQTAKKLEDRLAAVIADRIAQMDAPVDQMGDNKPWKLVALGFAAGCLFSAAIIIIW